MNIPPVPPQPSRKSKLKPLKTRTRNDFPRYSNMTDMSAQTGIPREVLQVAKKEGCPAFYSNSICCATFIRWWFNTELDEEKKADWTRRDKRASALIKETKLERLKGNSLDADAVRRFVTDITSNVFFAEFDRMAQELPAMLFGKNEVEISRECKLQKEAAVDALETRMAQLEKMKGEDE